MDSYILLIIGAELDFLGSVQYYESLYKAASINKNDYLKALNDEKAKKDAVVEQIRKYFDEKAKEANVINGFPEPKRY